MTTYASGAEHDISYVAESVLGTTPSTPAMIALRNTGCTVDVTTDTIQSNEIRSDRMIPDVILGPQKVAGAIPFALSFKEYDYLLEAAFQGTFTANVLKAAKVKKSLSLERRFTDVGVYRLFKGCMVDTLSLDMKVGAEVSGSFSLVGMSNVNDTTSVDASPTASQTYTPYNTFSGVLEEGGSEIAVVTGLSIQLQNSLTAAYVIGTKPAVTLFSGRSNLTGTVEAFFPDLTLLNKYLNETESSLEVVLGAGGTETYTLLIPRLKFTGGETPVDGEGPVLLRMPFQGLLDSVTGTNIQLTRTAS